MRKQLDTPSRVPQDTVSCPADCGVAVDIVYAEGLIWVTAEKQRLSVAVGLGDVAEAGYSIQTRTLGIALDSSLAYKEIPCSRPQAENILTHIGWDLSRLHVH
ncbi:hypothetical protein [Burkholderia cenocepacia]|uniref:hypothetical protein n=1 Tax=Burkholderia cenocepacia TaxID=95486 RepID=UPI00158AC7A0|nr:hypothetical protein [Burkholderia cenocepacia]